MNEDGFIHIVLTLDEVRAACYHGVHRRMAKLNGQRRDREQDQRSTWDNELEGACAELAFAKFRGVYWSGLTGLKAPDCPGFEIRWTKHYDTGGLFVYPRDADGRRYLLMDGFAPEYRIIGWLYAGEGKLDEWRDPTGKYLVPRLKLWEFSTRHI